MIQNNNLKDKYGKNHRKQQGASSSARKLNFSKNSSSLSSETRDKVLQIKKISEPFNPDIQRVFTEFVQHVDHLEHEDVDLPEITLLLRGAAKIYTSQVDSLVKDVENLLEHCTRTKKASIERRRSKRVDLQTEEDGTVSNKEANDTLQLSNDNNSDSGIGDREEEITDNEKNNCPAVEVSNEIGNSELSNEIGNSELSDKDKSIETITLDGDTTTKSPDENHIPDQNAAPVVDAAEVPLTVQPDGAIGGESSENDAQKRSHDLDESETPVKKKAKNGVILPPTLISCFEEWDRLVLSGVLEEGQENHLLPPSLGKAIRLAQRKFYTEENIPLAKKDFILGQDSQESPPATVPIGTNSSGIIEPPDFEFQMDSCGSLDIKPDISNGFSMSQEFPSAAAASFSPEDQAVIQECINDLHYLPFTFGLSKNDLSSAFSRTVDRMSQVFKKNNVPVNRHMVKVASVIATNPDKIEKPNGLIHPVAHSLGDIYNTFVKMCRKECESFITNTSMSIMERSKEKSFAESRANIRSMISKLQSIIVPKFARVPLMAENTPEFFQHVTNFEKKMKKILEEDAKKDEFDVRKYERDVLEVTAKESSELDRFDDFAMPNSPAKPQSIDGDHFDQFTSPSTRSSFDGSQSSCGSSWVPLKHIFHHMKSFDRTETARSFYAVLALLSYQNLDINYDQLYSVESAELIKKQLSGAGKEDELDSKFPRGVKIITSRCPDADKEEVFVAALTSESRDESFRRLLAKETRNIALRDGAPSSNALLTESRIDEGIAAAMAEFVEETSTVFTGKLQAKRRKKKIDTFD